MKQTFHIRYYFVFRIIFLFFIGFLYFFSYMEFIQWFWLLLEIFNACVSGQTRMRFLQLCSVWSTTCFLQEYLGYNERKNSHQSKIRCFYLQGTFNVRWHSWYLLSRDTSKTSAGRKRSSLPCQLLRQCLNNKTMVILK